LVFGERQQIRLDRNSSKVKILQSWEPQCSVLAQLPGSSIRRHNYKACTDILRVVCDTWTINSLSKLCTFISVNLNKIRQYYFTVGPIQKCFAATALQNEDCELKLYILINPRKVIDGQR